MADEQRDPHDGEYIGNIFGWRISAIGAVVILAFCALIAFRYYAYGVPIAFDDQLEIEEEKAKFAPPGKADRDSLELRE